MKGRHRAAPRSLVWIVTIKYQSCIESRSLVEFSNADIDIHRYSQLFVQKKPYPLCVTISGGEIMFRCMFIKLSAIVGAFPEYCVYRCTQMSKLKNSSPQACVIKLNY